MPRMAKYAIYIEFVFSLQSLELLTPTHPQFWTKIWLPLGSQLPVVRVRLDEDHLGCCQPSQLGRSSHLACSRPACPTPGIMRRDFIISLFLDTFEHGKCRETGERQISLKNNFFLFLVTVGLSSKLLWTSWDGPWNWASILTTWKIGTYFLQEVHIMTWSALHHKHCCHMQWGP